MMKFATLALAFALAMTTGSAVELQADSHPASAVNFFAQTANAKKTCKNQCGSKKGDCYTDCMCSYGSNTYCKKEWSED